MLILHAFIFIVLLLALGNLILNFLVLPTVGSKPTEIQDWPMVSILIPARNEEERIGPCLKSLLELDYPNYEIVVLDDCSEDRTTEVVRSFGFDSAGNRRVLAGQPLPAGWAGKPWACHQLGGEARGDFLLFTDADTVHAPGCLKGAMDLALKGNASLLSLWPGQIMKSWSEKWIIPLVYFAAVAFIPHFMIHFLQHRPAMARYVPEVLLKKLGGANGQFMLFSKKAYEELGGHSVASNHLVEDIALGREVTRRIGQGWRLINADGHDVLSCRMYSSFSEVWEGFSKNARPAFDDSTGSFLFVGGLFLAGFVLPFFLLPWAGFFSVVSLEIGLILLIRGLVAYRYRTSWPSVVFHPLAALLGSVIAINSWRLAATGRISWKKRIYAKEVSKT
ncbi:MAG: glycosyltransferase, partial [Verrucomicrobiota bacterium]